MESLQRTQCGMLFVNYPRAQKERERQLERSVVIASCRARDEIVQIRFIILG